MSTQSQRTLGGRTTPANRPDGDAAVASATPDGDRAESALERRLLIAFFVALAFGMTAWIGLLVGGCLWLLGWI